MGAGAQTGGDSGEQDRSQRADRGIVVLTGEHEPLVADGQGGVDLAGVLGGDEQGLAQAAIAGLGRSAVAVGLAGRVGGRDQSGEGADRGQVGESCWVAESSEDLGAQTRPAPGTERTIPAGSALS